MIKGAGIVSGEHGHHVFDGICSDGTGKNRRRVEKQRYCSTTSV